MSLFVNACALKFRIEGSMSTVSVDTHLPESFSSVGIKDDGSVVDAFLLQAIKPARMKQRIIILVIYFERSNFWSAYEYAPNEVIRLASIFDKAMPVRW